MIIEKLNFKSLLPIIGTITVFEFLSLFSYRIPWLHSAFFILICLGVAVVTYKKLEYGLLVLLTELLIGSQGYLFYFSLPQGRVSVRIGLFITVMAVWLIKHASWVRLKEYGRERITQLFFLFLGVLAVGGVLGLLHHNQLGTIIADGKRYLYFGLFFVFFDVYTHRQAIYNLLCVLFATVITVSIKSGLLLMIFIHNIGNELSTRWVYTWVRTSSRVGEITDMKNGFFRIFIQSQIFELAAIFITALFIARILYQRQIKKNTVSISEISNKKIAWYFSLLTLSCFTIVLSLSRSFWVGGVAAAAVTLPMLIRRLKIRGMMLIKTLSLSVLALVIAVGAVFALGGGFSKRFSASEPAASSRWKLLPPLLDQARKHPIIGSGFGTTVTFQTDDPRIKNEKNPEGWHTTYAFEWGYIDFVVKFGIIGTLVYFIFLGYVMYLGWKLTRGATENAFIAIGFLLGFIAVLGTHMFSPYLNHPLGIGYVLMSVGVFRALKTSSGEVTV